MAIRPIATPLNRHLLENPESCARSSERKALAFHLIEKICWVAFLAILASVVFVSYAGVTLTGSMPFALLLTIMISPAFAIGASRCAIIGTIHHKNGQFERGVAHQLQQIAAWEEPQIRQFLLEQHLDVQRIPVEILREFNAQSPLRVLLPLIARFRHLRDVQMQLEGAAQNTLRQRIAPQPLSETALKIRSVSVQHAWMVHEFEAFPKGLEAAVLLYLIQNPIVPHLTLSDVGTISAKSLQDRHVARTYAGIDPYFTFHADLRRNPISLGQLEQNIEPWALKALLFPRA